MGAVELDESLNRQVEAEFLDEARDIVNAMDVRLENVRSHAMAPEEALAAIVRDVHNLRMLGRSVNMPMITVATHRMADYLDGLKVLGPRQIDDLQTFSDKIRGVLEGDIRFDNEAEATLARALPAKTPIDFKIELLNIEVMLVIPEKAMAHIVTRELQACGYRTSNMRSAFEAIEMAVRTKPDMVIASLTLEGLSGVDLACAFSAMPRTANIPFALLTSYTWGHNSLEGLPPRAALIRKGPAFGDDLAEALSRFRIT